MRWELFLLNQFIIDCREAHQKGTKFHYSWLLTLIEMEAWNSPRHQCVQFPPAQEPDFIAPIYGEMWHIGRKEDYKQKEYYILCLVGRNEFSSEKSVTHPYVGNSRFQFNYEI